MFATDLLSCEGVVTGLQGSDLTWCEAAGCREQLKWLAVAAPQYEKRALARLQLAIEGRLAVLVLDECVRREQRFEIEFAAQPFNQRGDIVR